MALRRYRVARHVSMYVVVDHGKPAGTTTIGPNQAGANKTVPRYVSADADDPRTKTFVVHATDGLTPADKAEAVEQANSLNAAWEQSSDSPHGEVLSELDAKVRD